MIDLHIGFFTVKPGHIWHKGNVTVLYTISTKSLKTLTVLSYIFPLMQY